MEYWRKEKVTGKRGEVIYFRLGAPTLNLSEEPGQWLNATTDLSTDYGVRYVVLLTSLIFAREMTTLTDPGLFPSSGGIYPVCRGAFMCVIVYDLVRVDGVLF